MAIKIAPNIILDESEFNFTFIRAPGPGGQNVNKVASAVQLRFNVLLSPSLSSEIKARIFDLVSSRLTQEGEIIIKASRHRTQERNKQDAIERLIEMLMRVAIPPKKRKKTKPTYASKQKRLEKKKRHGNTKKLRDKGRSWE